MSVLASWLASPPPDAAIEIAADRVAAAVVTAHSDGLVVSAHAAEALHPGAVTPSLTGQNVPDRPTVVAAIARVLEKLGTRPRRVALVIPDTAVKVSLLRFDKVPSRRDDFEQLVRWQLRKAAPFAVESAAVTYSHGIALPDGGGEFVVELAREDAIKEYESLCEESGVYAGLVDTATFSLLGVFSGASATSGDWLLVHMRPDYTSIAIVRGEAVIFYRNRADDGQEGLADLVHQTAMYYQDRLSGGGFTHVFLTGGSRFAGAVDVARRGLEERLGVAVESLDSARAGSLTQRINATPDVLDVVGPAIGLLRRSHAEVPA